jgi:predicted Rossmann fold nucleotide-binding protein DprA/Smf involved in DNA uptake
MRLLSDDGAGGSCDNWQHLNSIANPLFWTPADPEYPQLLLETPSAPAVLYYRGNVDEIENVGDRQTVAIIGTRDITSYGRKWTQKISVALAERGALALFLDSLKASIQKPTMAA